MPALWEGSELSLIQFIELFLEFLLCQASSQQLEKLQETRQTCLSKSSESVWETDDEDASSVQGE